MWVTSFGLAGEAGIFASLPFYPMFSGVPNGPLRLSPPQVHAAVHNSGVNLAGDPNKKGDYIGSFDWRYFLIEEKRSAKMPTVSVEFLHET